MSNEKLLINDINSNNFEVNSNNSEFKSNNEKKQIEEMAKDFCISEEDAKYMYEVEGYRKQSEGEWEEYQLPHIICCSECDWGTGVEDKRQFHYCPNCGAKMKGGDR